MKTFILKHKRELGLFIAIVSVVSLGLAFWASSTITTQTRPYLYSSTHLIPANNTGLLLGTSQFLNNGNSNQYFENRIQATVLLYKAGKIKNIVISGDNSQKDYNEPEDMKRELIRHGIPENRIYLDFAGFRTYDSVFRMKAIFGQNNFTIISQEFHNERAVYIAKSLKLNAIGFNAKDPSAYNGFKTKVREKFARVKVFIDILINKKPKFMGDKITIKNN